MLYTDFGTPLYADIFVSSSSRRRVLSASGIVLDLNLNFLPLP